MARVAIIGASIGGLPAAYEARALLDKKHRVTVISNVGSFHFVPSNPWVAVGWRTRKDISFDLGPVLVKKGIEFVHATADRIDGVGSRSQHQGRYREQSKEGDRHLERHLSRRYGGYEDGLRGAAENGSTQCHVG